MEEIIDFRKSKKKKNKTTKQKNTTLDCASTGRRLSEFQAVDISEDLTWSLNTSGLDKKAQQCLFLGP